MASISGNLDLHTEKHSHLNKNVADNNFTPAANAATVGILYCSAHPGKWISKPKRVMLIFKSIEVRDCTLCPGNERDETNPDIIFCVKHPGVWMSRPSRRMCYPSIEVRNCPDCNTKFSHQISEGKWILTTGTSGDGSANFFGSNGEILLHINPRPDEERIVLNTFRSGDWGEEEELLFPVKLPIIFDVRVSDAGFHIIANRS